MIYALLYFLFGGLYKNFAQSELG